MASKMGILIHILELHTKTDMDTNTCDAIYRADLCSGFRCSNCAFNGIQDSKDTAEVLKTYELLEE